MTPIGILILVGIALIGGLSAGVVLSGPVRTELKKVHDVFVAEAKGLHAKLDHILEVVKGK